MQNIEPEEVSMYLYFSTLKTLVFFKHIFKNLYTALETPSAINDLSALTEIYEKSKPLVEKTEALANKIFPHDGQPIVQGNIIRTKFGNRK